jgi:calcineurin-like phosphoesterase family protein
MAIYITADLHFNHANIIDHAKRGYANVEEMNEDMIMKWNAVVEKENDIVWVLGDFAFVYSDKGIAEIFYRLRGRKHLIIGNHDERNQKVMHLPWERKEKLFTLRDNSRRAELCHYPLESWRGSNHGSIMLHGHSHGKMRPMHHRYDVGVDVWGRPVEWDMLWELSQLDRSTLSSVEC